MTELRKNSLRRRIIKHLPFYALLILPLIQVILFNYLPIYGVQIAFKDFKIGRGITGSEWVGFKHFNKMFADKQFYRVLFNTLRISIESNLITFPLTVVFALMMNEVRHTKFKRITQTITYLPHFLSWIIVGNFANQILSPTFGAVNAFLVGIGAIKEPIYFLAETEYYDFIYILFSIWKGLGWGIVIYLAAISGIDPTYYEAATIDGANRLQRVMHVTLPLLLPTISTMLILSLGGIMSVSFDATFNLYSPGTYEVADVLSTFVYRRGLIDRKYDYTTAIGLFQNVVGFILVLGSNWLARKADPDYRII